MTNVSTTKTYANEWEAAKAEEQHRMENWQEWVEAEEVYGDEHLEPPDMPFWAAWAPYEEGIIPI